MKSSPTRIHAIDQLNKLFSVETLHPLISLIDFSKVRFALDAGSYQFDMYVIILKGNVCGELRYGCNKYDYQAQTMLFFAPHQVIGIDDYEEAQNSETSTFALFFHPDLLLHTHLNKEIKEYNFFSYEIAEALHLSAQERESIKECFGKIDLELHRPIDQHSRRIMISNIDLLLVYCQRFYDRQFITRTILNKDLLSQFERLLTDYYTQHDGEQMGLPTVKYFADKLHLSASYMSDAIKRETGKTAQEHIQLRLIEQIKIELTSTNRSVSEIAYALGYAYPQYLSRQFKKRVGLSPNAYRQQSI